MSIPEIILLALALAMDCFAVSVSCSIVERKMPGSLVLRIALFFGLFQGGMTAIGWFLGTAFRDYIALFDHWIAFAILGFIGVKMIIASFKKGNCKSYDIKRWGVLITLSIATSIDALIAGMGLAFLKADIGPAAVVIGLITMVISFAGLFLGKKFGYICGNKAELIGGLVLIGIGIKILIEHLQA